MSVNLWTKEELEYLREHYPAEKAVDVACALGRPVRGIQHKASRLGIHKDERFFCVKSEYMKKSHPSMSRKMTSKGYVLRYVPEHPNASKTGHVMEHRLIMEEYLGRYLDKNTDVHHINGIKTDNRIENLAVMTHAEHTILHNIGGRK